MASPAQNPVTCPNCGAFLPQAGAELAALSQCPACLRQTHIIVFPAYERPMAVGAAAEKAVLDSEATCFYHPQNRAQLPCDSCGRFLCALCDLDLQGRHLCSACLETATKKGSLHSVERNRVRWDQIVALMVFLPLLFCYFLLPITSLVTLVLISLKWKTPGSLIANTRARLVVYASVAGLELVGSCVMWWFILSNVRHS